MSDGPGYGQYCPIAVTAEIIAERWTPLVLRALVLGATRYSEIHDSVPRMSPALLTRRLRELERAGVVERRPRTTGRGSDYVLTEAGRELFPVLESMGWWSQKWLRREITRDRNLDPDILMWEIRREARNAGRVLESRRVVRFHLHGVAPPKQRYWLVFESDDVDICLRDPGHEVDLWVEAPMRALVEVWLGHRSLDGALEDSSLKLDGDWGERAAFRDWFVLSRMAALAE